MNEKSRSEFLPPTPTRYAHAVWLTGCHGMLGRQVAVELARSGIPFIGTDTEVDITEKKVVMNFMARYRPRWIVNCAAYTAVDTAEREPEAAMQVNGVAPGILGESASRRGARVLHISTDYVFNGQSNRPYLETDSTAPVSVYGKTKLQGERTLIDACNEAIVIRISWLYGIHGGNFVETMLKLMNKQKEISVVADQLGAPTYAGELAKNILFLIERDAVSPGIYHYQDKGRISWYGFAREIQKKGLSRGILNKQCRIMPVTTGEFQTASKRPPFSVLNTEKVRQNLGFTVVDWKENLDKYFDELKEIRT